MTFIPGYGTERLHLGQSSDVLRSEFGSPQGKRRLGSFREYWLYPSYDVDAIVSRRTGKILSLFFRRLIDSRDDLFDLSEAEVRAQNPYPAHEGRGLELATGGYIGPWLTYDKGIGFSFDRTGKIETVSIFAKKRLKRESEPKRSKAKSASTNQTSQIAALRRA